MDRKKLVLRKLGWKRIARQVMRFGWILENAYEHTDRIVNEEYYLVFNENKFRVDKDTTVKDIVRMHLTFYRESGFTSYYKGVAILEFLYNITYFFKKIASFLALAALAVIIYLGHEYASIKPGTFQWEVLWICFAVIVFRFILGRLANFYSKKAYKIIKNN